MVRFPLLALSIVLAASARGLEYGPGWEVVLPDEDTTGVHANLWSLCEKFAKALGESTGTRPAVRFARQASATGHKFYVGGVFAERAGILPADMKGWSNGIAEKDGNVYFYGRDASGKVWAKGEWPSVKKMVLPSARAMTRFMYAFMGVRFVMPGENGCAVPKREMVSLPDGYVDRENPEFEFMAGRGIGTALDNIARGLYGPGSYHTYGGHTYPVALPRDLFQEHPEYFALRGGKRVLGATFGHTAGCISNPAVRQRIVDELLRRFDAGATVCQLAQNDGDASCQCEACRALYGTGDDWCEKLWLYHRDIAEEMLKLRPGKVVHILSYGQTHNPPKSFRKFPANVMVEMCDYSEEAFRAWKAYDVPQGFTVYTYLWGEYPPPGFTPKRSFAGLASVVRRLRENHVRGIFRCGYGELPGVEGPAYYYFDRLLQDPKAEIDATLKEWCDAAFGPVAGEPMRRFYLELDKRLRMFDSMSMGHFEADAPGTSAFLKAVPERPLDLFAYFYTPETLNVMEGCLDHAEAVESLTAKERIRLKRVRVEFSYLRNLGRIAVLYAGYKAAPSKATFLPLAKELQWRDAFIDRIYDEKGTVRKLKDWPDSPLFGGFPKEMFRANGRLSAVIGDPLNWDVDRMLAEEYYPGAPECVARAKAYNAAHRDRLQQLTNFRPYGRDLKVKLTVRPDGNGCAFETVPGVKDTRVIVTGMPKTGKLKPLTRYRVSWFARYTDILPPPRKEGGFCVLIQTGPGGSFGEPAISAGLTGSSGWRHMSRTFTTKEKPWDGCEVIFRVYDSQGRVEIEDVTIEELAGAGK